MYGWMYVYNMYVCMYIICMYVCLYIIWMCVSLYVVSILFIKLRNPALSFYATRIDLPIKGGSMITCYENF